MICFVDPQVPCSPDSPDNENGSLIVYLHDIFALQGENFIVQELIASGNFSDVYKVLNLQNNTMYAMKISRNKEAKGRSAEKEVLVLVTVQQCCSNNTLQNIGRMFGHFQLKGHTVIILDLYPTSLYSLLEKREFEGLQLSLVQRIARDLVSALRGLHKFNIIHTDIKPENIMVCSDENTRLIDFGGCICPGEPILTYIQSRWYRAPEVVFDLPFNFAIDIWSLGCVLVEAFIGVPIFAATDSLNLLQLIEQRISAFPVGVIKSLGERAPEYFNANGKVRNNSPGGVVQDLYQFNVTNLNDIIMNGPSYLPDDASRADLEIELRNKTIFLDLITKMLAIDPQERIPLEQVMDHTFLRIAV